MKKKYEVTLPTKEQPFTHFELGLESNEKECFADFKIEKTKELSGVLKELEQSLEQIKDFVTSLGENDNHSCSTIVAVILKVAHQVLDIFQKESAYLILRSFKPDGSDEDFKLPRWHQDGYYFAPYFDVFLKRTRSKSCNSFGGLI